jgi:hypothetical protein
MITNNQKNKNMANIKIKANMTLKQLENAEAKLKNEKARKAKLASVMKQKDSISKMK